MRYFEHVNRDPGRNVQLVFHGAYGREVQKSVNELNEGDEILPPRPRRPSLMDMGFALFGDPVLREAGRRSWHTIWSSIAIYYVLSTMY